ncbi:alpha/beta-hydrolase [Lanmaoa asiatica]|nr:alpha/beta-hydrolase [Lanmaoa asiatica]
MPTYVATPTIDYPKDKAILFLPDVFGIELINSQFQDVDCNESQLLADDFARNGFQVYVVDYLNGDAFPLDMFNVATPLISHSTRSSRSPAVAHPSLLKVPEDLHRYKETGIPLLINSCETDQMFPIEAQAQADVIIGGGSKTSELYQREHFAGCVHGFAVRGDLSIPEVKAGKERAFKVTVEFFLKHL